MTARRELLVVVASIAVAVAIRVPTLTQPLLEIHAFRQTQTAFQARIFHESGIDLLQPEVPVFGQPYALPYEFPLFQAFASLPMDVGIDPDPAMRLTALVSFVIAAFCLWRLVRRMADAVTAVAALVAFLFSPFAIVWSRTSMIEYFVIAAALGYLWAGLAWRDERAPWQWLVAVVLGSIAMTVKFQSAFFWGLPLLAYRPRSSRWRDAGLLALIAIPLVVGLGWTRYADVVRTADGARPWLGATALADFLFGAPLDRLDPTAWSAIAVALGLVVGPALLVILWSAKDARFVHGAQRRFWLSFIGAPLLAVVVFFNVYRIHDYYSAAITPSLAAALGLGAGALWSRRDLARASLPVIPLAVVVGFLTLATPVALALAVAVVAIAFLVRRLVQGDHHAAGRALPVVAVILIALNLATTSWYWGRAYASADEGDIGRILARARELASLSAADDPVIAVGHDWSPDLFYYAHRRGFMLADWLVDLPAASDIDFSRYTILHAWDPDRDPLWPAARSPWIGAIGAHTWALGRSFADLRGAVLASTDDESAYMGAARNGVPILSQPTKVTCDRETTLDAGRAGTWLRLDGTNRDARVRVSSDLAPVPARGVIVVAPGSGQLRVRCSGAAAIVIVAALDAAPPR
ncbi:MAG: hypothetical protein E6J49_15075 [Chloroflexi bacterium]|nr:MAG: hypothetical protein E6J49_15075 [Chloroflexota bacterium]